MGSWRKGRVGKCGGKVANGWRGCEQMDGGIWKLSGELCMGEGMSVGDQVGRDEG